MKSRVKKNMKKQQIQFDSDELEILSEQLDARDMYVLTFLNGFDKILNLQT